MIQASSSSLIVYIIVLLVFGISKAVSDKIKKTGTSLPGKKGQPSPHRGMTELPESWKDLFPREEVIKPEPVVQKNAPSSKPMKKSSAVFIQDPKEEGKHSIDERIISVDDSAADINNEDYAFQSIEDVRKAIVWSEIINKKYK